MAPSLPSRTLFPFPLHTASRTLSDPTAVSVVPVRVSAKAGFARAWNFQHPTAHITALGVMRCAPGEGRPINGVCTPIKGADTLSSSSSSSSSSAPTLPQAVLDREVGYTPVAIPGELVVPLGWAELPAGSTVWLFVPNSPNPGEEPGLGLQLASATHPLLQTYVDICVLGCLEFSREFAIEFIQSTVGWDGPWLNDREVARRPWIHQPKWRAVDDLLMEVIPIEYEARMLSSEYGAWLIGVAQATAAEGEETPVVTPALAEAASGHASVANEVYH